MTNTATDPFHIRLRRGDTLVGTFCKIPSALVTEVLAGTPLDCLCLDGEHGPFGPLEMDQSLMVARALGKPAIVRTRTSAPEHILAALDGGATALLVPHVRSAAEAAAVARSARFGPGGRGFAGHTRSALLGNRGMAEHFARSSEETCVIAQIEDAEALEELDAIAATPGIDALFVGRIDMTVSLGGLDPKAPAVLAVVERICAAGRRAGKPVGMFTPDLAELPRWRAAGASLFLLGSDQGLLQLGARKLAADIAAALAVTPSVPPAAGA